MSTEAQTTEMEAGAVLVLWAALLLGLLTMVAIAVDLGALRADRRSDRAAADAAATAGAGSLPLGSSAACAVAWEYALRNLGIDPLSTPSPCASLPACNPTTAASVTQAVGNYIIRIIHPVLIGDDVMKADAVGGDALQQYNSVADGNECDRLGVAINYTRSPIFARVFGSSAKTTSVHSVARYDETPGFGGDLPALVALERKDNCSVNAGNGLIRAFPTLPDSKGIVHPALIYTDSDSTGAGCSGGETTVFAGGNPGRIWADPAPGGASGELGYFAPTVAKAFDAEPSYIGIKTRLLERTTRSPVDKRYHCGNVSPKPATCVTSGIGQNDHIARLETAYGGTGMPGGFVEFPGAAVAGTCDNPPLIFPAGKNWYINCPLFEVKNRIVTFQDGDIVFSGNVTIDSNGDLVINSIGASGLPGTGDTTVVVRGTDGIRTKSTTWELHWFRTLVLMSNPACSPTTGSPDLTKCGRLQIDNGGGKWTAPTAGAFEDLIYWSESSQPHVFQGNPQFLWEGIFFAGNSLFDLTGNVVVDATNVQLWARAVNVQNQSAELRLRPDPDKALTITSRGSTLIR